MPLPVSYITQVKRQASELIFLKSQDPEGQHHPPSSTFHLDI